MGGVPLLAVWIACRFKLFGRLTVVSCLDGVPLLAVWMECHCGKRILIQPTLVNNEGCHYAHVILALIT